MTEMLSGEVTVRKNGQSQFLPVGEGVVEATSEHVTIATDMAFAVENIGNSAAEEARQRAAAGLSEEISDEGVASVNASLSRSLAQLHVKRRRRTH